MGFSLKSLPPILFRPGISLHHSGKETHKQGDCPGTGWVAEFVYVCFGVIPYGGEKTHKQNPQKNPEQSRENLFTCLNPIRKRLLTFSNFVSINWNQNYIAVAC